MRDGTTKKIIPSQCLVGDDGRPICVMCERPLRAAPVSLHWRLGPNVQPYGFEGNGMFCSMRCGFEWAVNKASVGQDQP